MYFLNAYLSSILWTARKQALTILLSCFVASLAQAATVKSANEKKRTVTVELGDDESFEKGTDLCIFSEAGKKIDCGKIVKIKPGLVLLKLKSKKRFKKILPGLEVKPSEKSTDSEGETTPSGEDETGAASKTDKHGKPFVGKSSPFRIWGDIVLGIAGPMHYNKPVFEAPGTGTTPSTLWSSGETVKTARLGLLGQVAIPIGSFSLNPGLRYMMHQPASVDADYVKQVANPYTTTEVSAKEYALFADFQVFRMPISPSFAFDFTTGLDMDFSTVTLKTKKKSDNAKNPVEGSDTLATATSKLTVISLRLGSGMDYMFLKSFGAHFGLGIMLPIYGKQSFSGSLTAGEEKGLTTDPSADLKDALGHGKSSLGIDMRLGLTLAF